MFIDEKTYEELCSNGGRELMEYLCSPVTSLPQDADLSRFAPQEYLKFCKRLQRKVGQAAEEWYKARFEHVGATWPKDVFLPSEAFMLIHEENVDTLPATHTPMFSENDMVDGVLAGCSIWSTWRFTQGIYRFNECFGKAIAESSLEGNIPCELFKRLPQWAVYVELPKLKLNTDLHINGQLLGYWAMLDWSIATEEYSLLILANMVSFDLNPILLGFRIPIDQNPNVDKVTGISEDRTKDNKILNLNIADFLRLRSSDLKQGEQFRKESVEREEALLRPILATLLYLCSTEPDVHNERFPESKPENQLPRSTKRGWKLTPPNGPRVWQVGNSFEAQLKQTANEYQSLQKAEVSDSGDSKRSVRSHVRSAHWHGYWKGQRPKEGEQDIRDLIFHWIPPLLVRGSKKTEKDESASEYDESLTESISHFSSAVTTH